MANIVKLFQKVNGETIEVPLGSNTGGDPFIESRVTVLENKVIDATTNNKGLVQLSNATDSTDETVAATSLAVKNTYDKASNAETVAITAQTTATEANSKAQEALTKAEEAVDAAYNLPIATTELVGGIKPDGVTLTVSSDGTASVIGGSGGSGEGSNITISDAIDSDSSTTAASSKAVKTAYDKATEAMNQAIVGGSGGGAAIIEISEDKTLMADDPRNLLVTTDMPGISIMLPDSSTIEADGVVFRVSVQGDYSVIVKDAFGRPLGNNSGRVSVGKTRLFLLMDKSSGLWITEDYGSENTNINYTEQVSLTQMVQTSLATVWDAENNPSNIEDVISISNNKLLISYRMSASPYLYRLIILEVTNNDISVGDIYGDALNMTYPRLAKLNGNQACVLYVRNNMKYITILNIDNKSITFGDEFPIDSNTNTETNIKLFSCGNNEFIVLSWSYKKSMTIKRILYDNTAGFSILEEKVIDITGINVSETVQTKHGNIVLFLGDAVNRKSYTCTVFVNNNTLSVGEYIEFDQSPLASAYAAYDPDNERILLNSYLSLRNSMIWLFDESGKLIFSKQNEYINNNQVAPHAINISRGIYIVPIFQNASAHSSVKLLQVSDSDIQELNTLDVPTRVFIWAEKLLINKFLCLWIENNQGVAIIVAIY